MKTFVNFALGFAFVPKAHADSGQPGHTYASAIKETKAQELATAELKSLLNKQKLTAEWANAPVKKNLYVILSISGAVKTINHVGAKRAHSHGSGRKSVLR